MTAEVAAVTFRCRDPRKVGMFWAQVLGVKVAATSDSGSTAILAAIPMYFQRAESPATAEGMPDDTVHLDLVSDDLDADATRLCELGATEVRRDQWHSSRSITFLDIEGNRFDLITR